MKKEPFVDKRNAVRFKLVPNPEGTDSNPNMFIAKFPDQQGDSHHPDVYRIFDDDYDYDPDEEIIQIDDPHSSTLLDQIEPASNPNVGEAAKYGILFDDRHYDYTQHLVAPSKQASSSQVFSLGASDLNHLIYDGIKEVITDPDVLETLEALEDDAYNETNFEDYFLSFHSTKKTEVRVKSKVETSIVPVEDPFDELIDIEEYSDESIDLNDEAYFTKYCNDQNENYDYSLLRDALKQPEFIISKYANEEEGGESNDFEFLAPPKKQQEQAKMIQKSNNSNNHKNNLKII